MEPNHTPSSRYKIKHSPAPPAKYTNSLKVKGPNILSSISKNCGTLNCIEFSARLVNYSSGDNLYGSAFCASGGLGGLTIFIFTLLDSSIFFRIGRKI